MDLLKEMLNITLIPLSFIAFLVVGPPICVTLSMFSIHQIVQTQRKPCWQSCALITGASSGIGEVS